jgi:hypothetical protein
VLHLHQHNTPQVRELAEVSEGIAAILTEQSARAMVAAEAERLVKELAAGASVEQLASAAGYTWQAEPGADRRNTAVPREVLVRAFELPAPEAEQTLIDTVTTPSGDTQVIALTGVTPGGLDTMAQEARLALQRQLSSEHANLVDNEFQRGLRESADISVM